MKLVVLVIAFGGLCLSDRPVPVEQKFPEAFKDVPELIEYHGYNVEIHHVTTEDGYVLALHRIPCDGKVICKGPVVLQHGAAFSSAAWILNDPKRSLAYILNEGGYDVWLPNMRGNLYSMDHTYLTNNQSQFWNFNIHHVGIYDMPAIIDYVLNETQADNLKFVGHSMGCTVLLILLSERPEYNSRIKATFCLAPAGACPHATTFLTPFPKIVAKLRDFLRCFGFHQLLQNDIFPKEMIVSFCDPANLTSKLCHLIWFFSGGSPSSQIDPDRVPVIAAHYPSGIALDIVAHYGQGILTGRFAQFDYGLQRNLVLYGTPQPPSYGFGNVTAPTYIFYGSDDTFTTPKDVKILASQIGNVVMLHEIPGVGHSEFVYGKDGHEIIYATIMKELSKLLSK